MDHDERDFDCCLRIQASSGGVEARHFATVTDDRTGLRTADARAVLDGDLSAFIPAATADRP